MAAAEQAIKDAGIDTVSDEIKLRTGVTVGSGIGGLETIYENSKILENKGPRRISPFFVPASLINLLSVQSNEAPSHQSLNQYSIF